MALNPQFKVNQLAKDLGIKSKEIIDILAGKGIEAKTQKTLEIAEFDLVFEALTKKNQIKGIEDYLDGKTKVPSKQKEENPAEPKKEAEPKKSEPTAEEKKVQPKPTPAPKEEKKEQKQAAAPTPKEDKKEEKKPEVKATAPADNTKKEKPAEQKKSEPTAQNAGAVRPAGNQQGGVRGQNPAQPSQNRSAAQGGQGNRFDRGAQNGQNRPASQGAQGGQGQNRFDRGAQGGQNGQNNRFDRGAQGGQGQNRFDRGAQGGQGNRFGAQGTQGAQRPQQRFDKDKDYQPEHGGLKEKFKVQPIVRSQSAPVDPSKRGATRVVDTRSSSVDLSKYDDKLETFVSEDVNNLRGGNQKLKKQNNNDRQGTQSKGGRNAKMQKKQSAPIKKQPVSLQIPDEITVAELASRLKVTAGEVVKKLMMMGMMVTLNQTIDFDTAALVCEELGAIYTKEVFVSIEEKLFTEEGADDESQLVERAPVVCVMGHVDHGKTSLLDAIRHTSVTTGEAGGITQHIGAYRVKVDGKDLTSLDPPGHEASTAMRARGAQATDIAILVVAADDGIMPQTVEAINHAKAAGVDIIVAINKMDKPTANPDNVKQALTQYNLVPEEWGGDVICVPVSALTHKGIDDLLENVLLVAEVKELKANPNCRAKGIIIESKLDKGRGPVATVLVQNGTLHSGDIVIAGTAVGRVRAMTDHNGRSLKVAGPSVPVEITGLAEVPEAGDEFNAVEDERMARTLADQRKDKAKEAVFKANARANLNDLFAQISEGVKDLNVIVKADVVGSAEAVKASLEKLSNEEVKVRVIHSAAGGINEGDVMLASASNAIIVGFNVRPDKTAVDMAERQEVDIRTYRVIYDCIDEITAAMKGMLAPKFREVILGHAEVRQTIHVPNVGTIAGSYILDGKVTRASQIRVLRDSVVIFEDKISSLRRFKDDVKEVADGYECGIGLDKFNDIKLGDVLEAFVMEEIQQ